MSVSKPSICFWKWVISIKWRNKLLIHNINLTGHRKSACCLQLLVLLEIWVIAPFWHWRTQVFTKGFCHHDHKVFCEAGYKSVLLNIIENKPWGTFKCLERALKNERVESKIVKKLPFNFTFGQGSCLISDFSRPNSSKAVVTVN